MMSGQFCISAFAGINNERIIRNGGIISDVNATSFDGLMDAAYGSMSLAYPKFHKMDSLSKLGFMTSEYLLMNNSSLETIDKTKVGLVISNKSSSLDTDLKYHNMLMKGIASPAVFVYTLPNILIGEICIRNKFKGESVFFITDTYNISNQVSYINLLLNSGILEACIGGWVELMKDSYKSFLYLVTKGDSGPEKEFKEDNLLKMFNQI